MLPTPKIEPWEDYDCEHCSCWDQEGYCCYCGDEDEEDDAE